MRKLLVFNNVTLDGYFSDVNGDMSWAHSQDPEWQAFTSENAKGESQMLFGRKTYDLMASFWPTPQGMKAFPSVAEAMNKAPKVVFSRTLDKATWNNTRLVKTDPAAEVRRLKNEPGPGMVIFGSGTIVSLLPQEGLIDEFQIVVIPIVLGKGKSMFAGVKDKLSLKLIKTRSFGNGNVLLCYEPSKR
jgi:dihydrofolate reductase